MSSSLIDLRIRTAEGLKDVAIGTADVELSQEEEEWLYELNPADKESLLEEIAYDAQQQVKKAIEWEKKRDEPDPDEGWEEYRRRRSEQ